MAIACEEDIVENVASGSKKEKKKLRPSDVTEATNFSPTENGKTTRFDEGSNDDKKNRKRKNDGSGMGHVKKKNKKIDAPPGNATDRGRILDNETEENPMDADEAGASNERKYTDKEVGRISGKSLRNGINSADGLATLKKFVSICNDSDDYDLATRYLDAGGSPLEILKLLDTTDKKNINNAVVVFSALDVVVMKILKKYPHYHASASEACRHLINSHLSSVHSMLSGQSNAKQRRVVLRLLTAVAALGGTLPRELLSHLSLHHQLLETLTRMMNPTDSHSVRTTFVHFVLAFLVEGNVSVVRALLDKRGVLASIVPNLLYDNHLLVHMFLTTIKSYVLENPGISKTIKLHTFSTPVVRNLVSLYNWKGPKNWPGKNPKKSTSESSGYTDPDEKQVVVETLHEFLSTLLTSNRFGIIFHDRTLGVSGRRNNQLVNTILQSLERPWEHEKPSDLVVRILVACPDLIKAQFIYTEPYLEPRESSKWLRLVDFIGRIIESLDPETCVKSCSSELMPLQLFSAIMPLTLPAIVLKNAIIPSLDHESITVRHASVKLLSKMLQQLEKFLKVVKNGDMDLPAVERVENLTMDYIVKNVPSLDSIITAWNKSLTHDVRNNQDSVTTEMIQITTRKENLTEMIDLLLTYQRICPRLLETVITSDSNVYAKTFLTGLDTLADVDTWELNEAKVKILTFLLALDVSALSPEKELFGEAIPFLTSLLENEQEQSIGIGAKTAMRTLLTSCGLFEGTDYQADIWIRSFLDIVDKDERVRIAEWLVKIARVVAKRTNKYARLIAKSEEAVGEQAYSGIAIDDIFADLTKDTEANDAKVVVRLQPTVSISPLLAGAIESLDEHGSTSISRYLSYVTVYTLHCQVAPDTLIHLVGNARDLPSFDYIRDWSSNRFIDTSANTSLDSKDFVVKLLGALLSKGVFDPNKLFQGSRRVSFGIDDEQFDVEHSLTGDDVLASVRLSVFYFAQFAREETLTEEFSRKLSLVLVALIRIARDVDEAVFLDSFKWITTHPYVLRYFTPLYKKKNTSEKFVTKLVLRVCEAVYELGEKSKLTELVRPFKEKFLRKITSAVNKCQNDSTAKEAPISLRLAELVQLEANDISELLLATLKLPVDKLISVETGRLSSWGSLVPILLDMSVVTEIDRREDIFESVTLDKNHVRRITTLVADFIARENSDAWISSLHGHLRKFLHNIDGVDKKFFKSLLSVTNRAAPVKFASFLVGKNPEFVTIFVKHVTNDVKAIENKTAVFSILSNIPNRSSLDKRFYEKLWKYYETDITRCFVEPASTELYIIENFEAAITLIETVIDSKTCNDICDKILSSGDKLIAVETRFVKMLESIFKKAGTFDTSGNGRLVDFAQILIHVMVSSLKKQSKDIERHNDLCDVVENVATIVRAYDKNNSSFHELRKNHSWPQFTRFSLKLGLKSSKDVGTRLKLLRTLAVLCDLVYEDDCDDEYPKLLFEMTTSHSEFIGTMLGSSEVKRDLIQLLGVLVRKRNSLMTSTHVPLYLGAYNATLGETDQLILQLLQYYESHKVRLTDYRPYLWGSAAASHYSVKSGADTALWRQPSTSQVLDLFVQETVLNTIRNYPVDRKLQNTELHPARSSTYDPAFYLPLLCYLLSDNSAVACHKITQSGSLALALAACSSTSESTRLAAFTVVSRFYYHLEATSSKEKLLWMHFIDLFRNGVISSKGTLSELKLSSLIATFMARTSIVATQPLNPLYLPLQKFLMAKPKLDLHNVPEFLQLFHSSEIEHKTHRCWILEIVRDGLKTNLDTEIAFNGVLFKMLLDFYTSVLADQQSKDLVLQVINSAVKIPKTALLLVTGYGLLAWLHEVVLALETRNSDSLTTIITIIADVLDSLEIMKDKSTDAYFMLLKSLINLKSHLSPSVSPETYGTYLRSVGKIFSVKSDFCRILTFEEARELVKLSRKIIGETNECEDVLRFGAKYVSMKSIPDNATARDYVKFVIVAWSLHR